MDFKIDELREMLENSEGFSLTLTTRKENKLNHFFYHEKFYDGDLLSSLNECEKLIINKLKNRIADAEIVETTDAKDTQ